MRTLEGNDVNWTETLWRYCTADRFEWIVNNRKLYFASANQFVDPFEGAVAVQTNVSPPDPRYAEMEYPEKAFFQLKRLTKLNCWHRAEYESDAMWKLYAGARKGIAICSSAERLRNAVGPYKIQQQYADETLWGGPVRYIDLTQVRMPPSTLDRFFYKHLAFAWEREFRLAVSVASAEEFAVNVPEMGIEVPVNLDRLIDHIIVGPEIPAAQRERVVALAGAAGFEARIRYSSLLGKPRYI